MSPGPENTGVEPTIKHPFLDKLLHESRQTKSHILELPKHYSDVQLSWKPAANKWSMLECVEHLNTTMRLYLPALAKHLLDVRRRAEKGNIPFKATRFGKMFIGFILPENQRKLKTVGVFKPATDNLIADRVFERYDRYSDQLHRLIADSDGLALNGKKFASPVSVLVRFTLGEGLWLQVAHNERHYRQAERLATLAEFPQ